MGRVIILFIAAALWAKMACASTVVYYNQAQWQAAISNQGSSLTNVNLNSSAWSDSLQLSKTYTNLQSKSNTAAGGAAITVNSGYGEPGLQDNSQLGHVSNGGWTDTQGKYGSTTFNFSNAIYGFAGNFDISNRNGLDFYLADSQLISSPGGTYDGFIGVVSNDPLTSVLISWGQNGCGNTFGDSYTLTNFQLATNPVSTPEPNFRYASAGLLIFIICFVKFRHQ